MKSTKRIAFLFLVAGVCIVPVKAKSAGTNWNHELMVYSIEDYGNLYDHVTDSTHDWKIDIGLTNAKDPYYDFWDDMNCSSSQCMHTNSVRRRNSAVTVNNMRNTSTGWPAADMVFFFGHNTMIRPQWDHEFNVWRYYYIWNGSYFVGSWGEYPIAEWEDWGTSAEPYRYHRTQISNASLSNSFAVFYAYKPLTSILVGKDFTTGTWYTENTWNQSSADSNTGQLGSSDTEWIIAHGCNAVTVATPPSGTWMNSLGVNAWKKSWSRLHTVLGHYYTTTVSGEPELDDFAAALKGGDIIKDAYFDIHTTYSSSQPAKYMPGAISIHPIDDGCCWWNSSNSMWYCNHDGCGNAFMDNETWTSPLPDLPSGQKHYATTWKVAE